MKELKDPKVNRVLTIFEKLKEGEGINTKKSAEEFCVNEKTIQRDINDIRSYIANNNKNLSIVYKRSKKAYFLVEDENLGLHKEDILAMCKILLESRAFCNEEMHHIINSKLLNVYTQDNQLIQKM